MNANSNPNQHPNLNPALHPHPHPHPTRLSRHPGQQRRCSLWAARTNNDSQRPLPTRALEAIYQISARAKLLWERACGAWCGVRANRNTAR